MRFAPILLAAMLATPTDAATKEFRYYYGLQWEWEPTALTRPTEVVRGQVVAQTRLLPTALFTLDADFYAGGKLILAKGTQLAPAVSAKSVRCSLGPGKAGSLGADRRVCVIDIDKDGAFDAYFDEGLGMEFSQLQFTGCLPTDPARGVVPTMSPVDPAAVEWPFVVTVSLGRAMPAKTAKDGSVRLAWYRFDVVVKRNDKPALQFHLCRAGYQGCWVSDREIVRMKGGLTFRPSWVDGGKVRIDVLRPFERADYWDMSPAGRPDPLYCPGTLFVKTDQRESW